MWITKCDLCKKEIEGDHVTAGAGYSSKVELCQNCGLPVIKFLKKNKFIKEEKPKTKSN
jgi:ribosome-binding protein aMBF1 (putative translation factor)